MSGFNSALGFYTKNPEDLREAMGIPRFTGASGTDWDFTFNGLVFQGGLATIANPSSTIDFHAPFSQQVLGVFLEPVTATGPVKLSGAPSLTQFSASNSGSSGTVYWFALGV